ncbi:hypothetical protein SCLCIDRAFT_149026 [Scleroderma citrinum Foug A]|uniref:Uncharacterized protein n=1 Tax=Scleroderma citrinum Foug A TaxID=1036808 RepID=A0A0C3ERH3_9AGAM|nr:hypothetical protein SCLCIDRAFT_149026 [Scleroderma citrinum Foug A]
MFRNAENPDTSLRAPQDSSTPEEITDLGIKVKSKSHNSSHGIIIRISYYIATTSDPYQSVRFFGRCQPPSHFMPPL